MECTHEMQNQYYRLYFEQQNRRCRIGETSYLAPGARISSLNPTWVKVAQPCDRPNWQRGPFGWVFAVPEKWSDNGLCVCPHPCSRNGRRPFDSVWRVAGVSFLGHLTRSQKIVPGYALLTSSLKCFLFSSLCRLARVSFSEMCVFRTDTDQHRGTPTGTQTQRERHNTPERHRETRSHTETHRELDRRKGEEQTKN